MDNSNNFGIDLRPDVAVVGVLILVGIFGHLIFGASDDSSVASVDRTQTVATTPIENESEFSTQEIEAPRETLEAIGESNTPAATDSVVVIETVPTTTSLPEALDGDLGLFSQISKPSCDGSFVVFVGAATDPPGYTDRLVSLMSQFPSSNYLQTASTGCASLRQKVDGNDIYSVFYGPYSDRASACSELRRVGGDAYVKRLDNSTPVDEFWTRSNC